ncbi:YdiU family protein [Bacillus sp. 1P10SD]|uniref:protein adenylyltransferase SelO n=1 Tax=Bacillus sp. 1P10SD TaxID=3132265 RepID=UPI0039A6D8D9
MTKEMKDPGWKFDNSYTKLPEAFYKSTNPTPVNSPQLVILNGTLAKSLGLNVQALQEEGIAVFAGNRIPEGASPLAQAYAGHQFGHFTMLGDGRAVLLGEQITPKNERVDIQLKGPGRTPFSRGGDGRAALGPMLREYIISEAMHALGIPTTRSLAVVTTGEPVYRETVLPGAILTRVAASHIRVGTFQYAARFGTVEDLQALADYTINRHYPEIEDDENKYLSFLKEVIKLQAALIAKWQLVGFIHGVMNTDNMAISGETIDYGPCAFMDEYSPATVFSSIDREGRYAYGNQPYIAVWNLARFAESLLSLLHEKQDEAVKLAEETLSGYGALFEGAWLAGMRAKLGIFHEEEQDEALVKELLQLMEKHRADYTNTFIALTFDKQKNNALFVDPKFEHWYEKWQARLERQQESKESSHELMRKSNPSVIPRNHRVEEALEAAVEKGDFSVLDKLLQVISNPYAHSPEQEEYCTLPAPSSRPYQTFCGT